MNVACGVEHTLLELHEDLSSLIGGGHHPKFADPRTGDVKHSLAAIELASSLLDYSPTVGWREGLGQTVAWYAEATSVASAREPLMVAVG